MSIWTYSDVSSKKFPYGVKGLQVREGTEEGNRIVNLWNEKQCPFCHNKLKKPICESKKEVTSNPPPWPNHHEYRTLHVEVCPICGWWKAQHISEWHNPGESCYDLYQGGASLKELDISDLTIPIQEIQNYLVAKYEDRFKVHPKRFEEIVGSVFNNLGYSAIVTGYSGDDGIDVILDSGRETIGVQVKRYKNKIEVEQIRSLAGALVLNGMTKGVFVTTSSFQSGVESTVEKYKEKDYRIELHDADRFFAALSISQREMYKSVEEFEYLDVIKKIPLLRHIMEH